MSANLISEIRRAIAVKANSVGCSRVFNSASTEVVVYFDQKIDITDAVLAQLNAGAQ